MKKKTPKEMKISLEEARIATSKAWCKRKTSER